MYITVHFNDLLGFPSSTSPQQGIHLQQTYTCTLTQSVTGAPSTTSRVPSPSTHGSASHRGQHTVPSTNNITNVEMSPLPLPSQHLSQGASHNQLTLPGAKYCAITCITKW